MQKADFWIVEGTFKISHGEFFQMLTLDFFILGKSFPGF